MGERQYKVLVLNPYIPTLGGGEKHMGYLCRFMESYFENVQIDILVHDYNEINVHAEDYLSIEDINKQFGLDLKHTFIKKVDLRKSAKTRDVLANKKFIEDMTADYDLFINFMFMSKHIGKAKNNIYECMFPPKRYAVEQQGLIRKLYGACLDKKFYKSYQSFVSNSLYTNHWLSTFWQPSAKNTTIYPPVFSKKEIAGRYEEQKKKNIIISVGRFFVAAHSKKQLELVKIFVNNKEEFEGYEYHLVGAVSNLPKDMEYLEEIKKLAATVDNVFIHENYPYAKLMELYKEAKLFWHGTGYGVDENMEPEKMEHFGITTVEAMSFGAVPVVINKGGQKETVIHGENGFLWTTEEECVACTKQLIENDDLRRKMAELSAERSNLYSIEEFYEANRRLFNEKGI